MHVTLQQIKKHLNIDDTFTADDEYLNALIEVAESTVQRHICCHFADLENNEGQIPAPLSQAVKMYVGVLYNSRESVVFGTTPVDVPFTFDYLLGMYKNYKDTTSDDFIKNALDNIAKHTLLSDTPEEQEIAPYGDVAISVEDKALKRIAETARINNAGIMAVDVERI